tara:strand:- start:177 stop:350 length:174 start_codon:yes stop_codon:yes gene_type:complete
MKSQIEEILKRSYTNSGEFDESKATKELVVLYDNLKKYREETAVETIARLQEKAWNS